MDAEIKYDCFVFNIEGPACMTVLHDDETESECSWIDFGLAAINHPLVVDMGYSELNYDFVKDFNPHLRVTTVDFFEVVLNSISGLLHIPEYPGFENGKFIGHFPGKPSKAEVLEIWNTHLLFVRLESVGITESYGSVFCTISLYLDINK